MTTDINVSFGQPEVELETNILDIELPPELEHSIKTGNHFTDELFAGDGILPSTVALVTGCPGSGKTTLMLQMADTLTAMGHKAIYNTGEESIYQVRRVTKRLNLRHGFLPKYENKVEKLLEHADNVAAAHPDKKVFIIQDSLQCLETTPEEGRRGRPQSREKEIVEAAAKVTQWAKDSFHVALIIGQVGKQNQFIGKQVIKHMVDCHLHLDFDTDRRSDTHGERTAEMTKNRFGVAGTYYAYELGNRGIRFR